MLEMIDKLAGWWLDWRIGHAIAQHPELHEFGLKKAEFDENGFHVVASFPGVVVLADEAARMLNANGAENYVEFDMMPRLDRGMRPIRVTVQWADGMSPAQKAMMLERQVARSTRIDLVFDDWRKDGQTVYDTEEGMELSLGDFHTGTTFSGGIELDAVSERELRGALEAGCEPLFVVSSVQSCGEGDSFGDL